MCNISSGGAFLGLVIFKGERIDPTFSTFMVARPSFSFTYCSKAMMIHTCRRKKVKETPQICSAHKIFSSRTGSSWTLHTSLLTWNRLSSSYLLILQYLSMSNYYRSRNICRSCIICWHHTFLASTKSYKFMLDFIIFQVDTLEIRNCEVSARRTDEDHHGVRSFWCLDQDYQDV